MEVFPDFRGSPECLNQGVTSHAERDVCWEIRWHTSPCG